MSTYKLTLTADFPADIAANGRHRAGIFIDRVHGYEGPLTDEQLQSVKSDRFVIVESAGEEASEAPTKPSEAKKPVKK